MDKLKAIRTFVAIVDAGSLTAAASRFGQSTASVARSLSALEGHLGVRLLNRTTRRLALTDEGAEYLTWSRHMLADVEAIERRFEENQTMPTGVLRVTAPIEFGRIHVAPVVEAFLLSHPAIQVELILLDRVVDLLEEGLDLAVRIGRLPASDMKTIMLGTTRSVVCAAPSYLANRPEFGHPNDLQAHACLAHIPQGRSWAFVEEGRPLTVEITPWLAANHVQVVRQACVDGLGITSLLHYQVASDLAEGRLVRILRSFQTPEQPIHMVFPHSRLLSPRVRRFIDWCAPRLKASASSTP